ncbi:DUF3006 family protein [Ornithinibacillus sp. L9]|uniref:DUF3006 family protein n=1 Tax=Ornithinibacillus caprae TaxID=2678566 RepID=A0A6N8FDU1_9BACI|nr:DUF3006 domain-containing protein [Ornithinibacillus caprae]MUK87703.1 DUF3006 family protein [Ornithinibacillus caprae]
MQVQGVLDRFEDQNQAVILIEELKEELVVSKDTLPAGSEVNTYFTLEKNEDGDFTILAINEKATQAATNKTSNLIAKLRAKNQGSKFKKK